MTSPPQTKLHLPAGLVRNYFFRDDCPPELLEELRSGAKLTAKRAA